MPATSPSSSPNRDTVYIDIDDEITAIIDKLRASEGKVVALVLPKRATVFQSIVNMKLLKRAADDARKHIVLITSEAGLLPLAGVAGVHVAKTLDTKPEIPMAPNQDTDTEETVDEDSGEPEEINLADSADKPIGSLAGPATAVAGPALDDQMETIELDDDDIPEEADAALPVASKDFTPKKAKKDKKLSVPNFEKFRLLLALGALLFIILIAGLVVAAKVLPKATINVTTDATNVNTSLTLNLSTTANTLDASTSTVPAKLQQQTKTYSQQVTTTGQKNEGTKATGTVTISAGSCGATFPDNLAAGTPLTAGNYTYVLQEAVTFAATNSHGHCTFQGIDSQGQSNIDISAQSAGASYNTDSLATTFTISGEPGDTATGSATGGTDNNVQVVAQADIDSAKAKITTSDATIKQNLENQLQQEGYVAIDATYSAGTPTITNSANVGDTANTVTVTETIAYSVFGVHEADLKTLVDNQVKTQIDTSKQSILDEGLSNANYNVQNATATGAQVTLSTVAVAGPELSADTIKQEAAGKKSGDVQSELQTDPDVKNVSVKLSPFWVTSVPKNTSKITVTIAKPTNTASSTNADSNP